MDEALKAVPDWVKLLLMGVGMLAWLEHRFVTQKEFTKHREANHKTANVLQKVVLELNAARVDRQWMIDALYSVAHKVGANGFLPPPKNDRRPLEEET